MATFTTDRTGREAPSCLPASRLLRAGACAVPAMRPAVPAVLPVRECIGGRAARATAVAAAARVQACAPAFAADGADNGRKKSQHHEIRAFRGLDPWRFPA